MLKRLGGLILLLIGIVVGVILSLSSGGVAVALLYMQTNAPQTEPLINPQATATAIPMPSVTPTVAPTATPNDTPIPPDPTAVPAGRRDVQIRIAESYLAVDVAIGLKNSEVGAAIEDSSLDIQPGNIAVIRARPKGSTSFALTFTSQLSLAGNRIVVTPLSSSALLTPFRGRIARTIEDNINARVDRYRENNSFRILSLTTTGDEVLIDLALR